MLSRFRKISLFMAYAVATIPLWHYISETSILLLMTAVVIFAYLNIVLSSVDAAQAILSSEKAKTPFPRWLPKKPKYEKWWLIVRHTLKWHLLLVPAKMGLALGFVELLYIRDVNLIDSYPIFTNLFTYISHNALQYVSEIIYSSSPYPQWETVLISVSAITLIALLETSLVAAISLATKTIKRITTIRIFISLGLFGLIFLVYCMTEQIYSGEHFWVSPCSWYLDKPSEEQREFVNNASIDCIKKRVAETIMIALVTPIDQNILLSANIMRPQIHYSYDDYNLNHPLVWDNRLFVLRQCVAAVLGIFLYLGTTWAILYFAEDEKPHSR